MILFTVFNARAKPLAVTSYKIYPHHILWDFLQITFIWTKSSFLPLSLKRQLLSPVNSLVCPTRFSFAGPPFWRLHHSEPLLLAWIIRNKWSRKYCTAKLKVHSIVNGRPMAMVCTLNICINVLPDPNVILVGAKWIDIVSLFFQAIKSIVVLIAHL